MGNLYKIYLNNRNNAVDGDNTKTVSFAHDGQTYRIIIIKRRANRLYLIRCAARTVVWEQLSYLWLRYNEKGRGDVIVNISVNIDKKCVTIFVIKENRETFGGLMMGSYARRINLTRRSLTLCPKKQKIIVKNKPKGSFFN